MPEKYPARLASVRQWSSTTILMTAFLAGSLLLVSLRLLIGSLLGGLHGAMVAAALAVFIIGVVAVHYNKEHRLIEDRQMAGDNLYYLGLLFTLVSLVFALLQLFVLETEAEVDERANDLIGNFGIALLSTVAGILARIVFQNPVNDTVNATAEPTGQAKGGHEEPLEPAPAGEPTHQAPIRAVDIQGETARLQEDLIRLRLTLRQANDGFLHFCRVCHEQSMNVVNQTDSLIKKQTEDFQKVAEHQLAQTSASLQSITEAFQTEISTLSTHFLEVVSQFNQHMTAEANRGIAATSKAWVETADRLKADGENQIKAIYGDINGLLAGAEKSWVRLSELSQMIAGAMDSMRMNIETIQSMTESSATASLETNNLVKAMKNAQAELDLAGSSVAASAATAAASVREISEILGALAGDMHQARLAATEEYRKVTAGITSQINQQVESDGSKLKGTLVNAVDDIDSCYKTGLETLQQAQQLSKQMTREAEEWKNLAEHTRKSLVSAAEHLAKRVRKS